MANVGGTTLLGGTGAGDALTWMTRIVRFITGFHCHATIKTIQQINSRIKEEKEGEYSNSVTNNSGCVGNI